MLGSTSAVPPRTASTRGKTNEEPHGSFVEGRRRPRFDGIRAPARSALLGSYRNTGHVSERYQLGVQPSRKQPDRDLMSKNKKKKRIETAIAWAGYSIVVIGVILLLILLRQQS